MTEIPTVDWFLEISIQIQVLSPQLYDFSFLFLLNQLSWPVERRPFVLLLGNMHPSCYKKKCCRTAKHMPEIPCYLKHQSPVIIYWFVASLVLTYAVNALNVFYTTMNSPPQLTNWVSENGDPCGQSWLGVTCSGSRVTAMWASWNLQTGWLFSRNGDRSSSADFPFFILPEYARQKVIWDEA